MNDYIEEWLKRKNNIFPGDELILEKQYSVNYTTSQEYIKSSSFNDPMDNKFHIGLSPLPFLGNLSRASVFILTLNPGLHISDYFTENNPVFQKCLEDNFNQVLEKYPLFFLNPELGFHAGYDYWNKQIKSLREALCERLNLSREIIQKFLAKEIAVLELIPYHAQGNPNRNKSILSLPSVKAVTNYARTVLQPKALKEEILILNFRAVKEWGLEKGEHILKDFNPRNPSLNPKNTHGKRLLEFLLPRYRS